jgi:uncharacterized protein YndB with AHSA1/START domain
MSETAFEASQWIDAPPEIVFEYFVDPEKIVQWMGLSARVEAIEGGEWVVLFPGDVETWGRFVEIDFPNKLVFSWGSRLQRGEAGEGKPGLTVKGDSRVEVTLRGKAGRTLLTLKHSGFAPGEPVEAGWVPFLAKLADVVVLI